MKPILALLPWALSLWTMIPGCAQSLHQPPHALYSRTGAATDVVRHPRAGYALMGGGTDLDEAFRWLCDHADGGDLIVLRASGDNAYNPYINGLCKLNSVATIVTPIVRPRSSRSSLTKSAPHPPSSSPAATRKCTSATGVELRSKPPCAMR